MASPPQLALKVDCDTYEGTKKGIPNLLRLFDRAQIRASFFFTLGPDRSGLAVRRIFTQRGFLTKMLRSNAASLYGPKTMLYGTLLPAPMIGRKLRDVIRSVHAAGHDVGVHGWDHVRWHDRLDKLSEEEMRHDYGQAHDMFASVFGFPARSSAAPGWHATPDFLNLQDEYQLLYSSNTRQGPPHFPCANGKRYRTLEIPSTLPTWDEALANPKMENPKKIRDFYCAAIQGAEVHTIHTEVEGMAHLGLFEKQIEAWRSNAVPFVALDDMAEMLLKNPAQVPVHQPTRISLPNRGGLVSSSSPLPSVIQVN